MFWKLALQDYIRKPQSFQETIFWDDKVVIIGDAFPKAQFHLLVLPRDPQLTKKHPTTAFDGNEKSHLQPYVIKAQEYIFEKFTAKFSPLNGNPFFEHEQEFFDRDTFIQRFIQVGIHSAPSMDNLHVHVITKDFHSPKLKNKKHYLSFNSDFFVLWSQLPLPQTPDTKQQEQLLKNQDMVCTYCHANFKNRMQHLKEHLEIEFNKNFAERL
ncbi:hypothetical protein ZYGR_0U01440 [Zygosaccharomyces rouxii]|uniref:ZYRO0F11924p n=2 Tax=Zygosaccharomyces rouxii TaxID=4956 RepID=C5DYC4_ZYGRC|nr:uncharacterized protein ZYRO0F11924g [Zygosaccharomyces rouxii]KAH9199544.1 HIT-like domain-containing protein [Zygosaccharomyces rouxii]GAV50288.1 hypothetical protein ZYGR_0U01440 [Zygosaccharomyces rouxii]CAR28785.1 ZYRO0F11924p [Zygosaccharomyces rouxii]